MQMVKNIHAGYALVVKNVLSFLVGKNIKIFQVKRGVLILCLKCLEFDGKTINI